MLPRTLKAGLALVALTASAASAEMAAKVGVLNDQSGAYADIGGQGSVIAARMAAEDFQAAQKGLAIEIISADHQNKADIGSTIARRWYDTEGVDAIVDVPTSSVAFAASQITRDKNKVLLVTGAAASDLTGAQCSPNTIHWTFDTYALSQAVARAQVSRGADTWFFLTADYSYGHALERETGAMVTKLGGKVLGSVRAPFPSSDFASYLLQAQASKAKMIGLANGGTDTTNAIKQANEFGLIQSGQKVASLSLFISDIDAMGLQAAQGVLFAQPFYWDLSEKTRAWSQRFAERNGGRMPTEDHAGVYSSLLQYFRAVMATGDKSGTKVVAKMKEAEFDDPLFGRSSIRADGRKLHDMYVFEVKKPSESKGRWDYSKLLATVPAADAFRPQAEGGCPLVRM